MSTIRLTASLDFQLTGDAKVSPVPLSFLSQYSQKALLELAFDDAQTDLLIVDGTVSKPQVILVVCTEGRMDLKFDNGSSAAGTGIIRLNMDVTPVPAYPAFFLYRTNDPSATALYVTTPGPAIGQIWLFQ